MCWGLELETVQHPWPSPNVVSHTVMLFLFLCSFFFSTPLAQLHLISDGIRGKPCDAQCSVFCTFFSCRYRSLVRTIRELRASRLLMTAVPRLETLIAPVVVEEEDQLTQIPQQSRTVRLSSRRLWRSFQQVYYCLHVITWFPDILLSDIWTIFVVLYLVSHLKPQQRKSQMQEQLTGVFSVAYMSHIYVISLSIYSIISDHLSLVSIYVISYCCLSSGTMWTKYVCDWPVWCCLSSQCPVLTHCCSALIWYCNITSYGICLRVLVLPSQTWTCCSWSKQERRVSSTKPGWPGGRVRATACSPARSARKVHISLTGGLDLQAFLWNGSSDNQSVLRLRCRGKDQNFISSHS